MFGPGRARVQNGRVEDEKHATFPGTLRSQMPRNCVLLSGKFTPVSILSLNYEVYQSVYNADTIEQVE